MTGIDTNTQLTIDEMLLLENLLRKQKAAKLPDDAVMREDFVDWMAARLTVFDIYWREQGVNNPSTYPEWMTTRERWIEAFNSWLKTQ